MLMFMLLLALFRPPKLTSKSRRHEHEQEKLAYPSRHGPHLPLARACSVFTFVFVVVRAAQERHLVQHVLLEPFDPEINHWRDE